MKRFYLVRHGQTEHNMEGRVQGWADSPLTPAGIWQARQAANWLKANAIDFEAVYTSDLGRAVQTAQIIGQGHPAYAMEALREITFGKWDGTSAASLPDEAAILADGGETVSQCIQRFVQGVLTALDREDKPFVLVSHGVPLLAFYALTAHPGLPELEGIPNGGILIYDFDGSSFTCQGGFDGKEDFVPDASR